MRAGASVNSTRRERRARRFVVWVGLAVIIGALAWGGVYLWRRPAREREKATPTYELPPLSTSPYLNIGPDAKYVGVAACAECHPNEDRTYHQTGHSLALCDLDAAAEPADTEFTHAASGRVYKVYRDGARMRHRESMHDERGKAYAVGDFPIRYRVGSGHHTRSYLVEVDGQLIESPVTWYASRHAWDMSPGFDRPNHQGFERAADGSCLFCHVGRTTASRHDYQRLTVVEQPIGCERCHGPGSLHVAEERAARDGQRPAIDGPRLTIVRPDRLTRSLREAVCAQCHLTAETGVMVRGRNMTDFRPGLPLSDFCVNYRLDEPASRMKVVGHVEQLRLSRCYQKSDTLTCTTCHDPHASTRPDLKQARYLRVCASCHSGEGCRLERAERLRRNPDNDCIACHMPRTKTDVPHVAFTHHRIGIHSDSPAEAPARPRRLAALVPVDDVSHLSPVDRERNLALAYFSMSGRQPDPQAAEAYRDTARQLMRGVRSRGLRDGEVATALAWLERPSGPDVALGLAREALEDPLLHPKLRVNCLYLIGEVGLQTSRLDIALPALQELTGLRLLSQDWLLLAACRMQGGDLPGSLRALERAAAISPFRSEVRYAMARVHARLGNAEAARREQGIADRLAAQAKPKP
jgi:predicted CXXCH cytochrome family protein